MAICLEEEQHTLYDSFAELHQLVSVVVDKALKGVTTMHNWKFLNHPHRGHKFYQDESGSVALADDSGRLPEDTEDGILWLNRNLYMEMDNKGSVSIPVLVHREHDKDAHTGGDLTEALYISETFFVPIIYTRTDGVKVVIESKPLVENNKFGLKVK
jgi:hypothetical protein